MLLCKIFISYWEVSLKWDLSFFSLDKKRCMFPRGSILIDAGKKTTPILMILLNKKWIFYIKAKSLLFKVAKVKKKFRAIRWILSYAQSPLVDFWSIPKLQSKTDQMGKISKVSLCLKHVQSPRRIKFWDFFLSNE